MHEFSPTATCGVRKGNRLICSVLHIEPCSKTGVRSARPKPRLRDSVRGKRRK